MQQLTKQEEIVLRKVIAGDYVKSIGPNSYTRLQSALAKLRYGTSTVGSLPEDDYYCDYSLKWLQEYPQIATKLVDSYIQAVSLSVDAYWRLRSDPEFTAQFIKLMQK